MTQFLNKLPFAHHAWFMYLRLLVRHYIDDNCTQKASSLTYTTLLSVVPMIAILLVIFSTVPILSGVRDQVQEMIYNNLLPSSSKQVSEYINNFAQNSARFTVIGVGVLLFTTVSMLITIETAFNQIWRIEEKTGGLKSILHYVLMILGLPVVLAMAFMASSAIQSANFFNRQIGGYSIDWVIWAEIASFVFVVLGFIAMYFLMPKVKVPFKNAVIAGVVVAILFECVKRFFGLAVSNFTSYQAVYGAFAALPIFLMWIYISWNLILLGVEISYTLTIFDTEEVPVRHPMLSLLDMLNAVYKNQNKDKSTSEEELRQVLGRKERPKWQTYLNQLQHAHLITPTETGEYRLKTNLSTISLWQFYRSLPYPLPIKGELTQLKTADYDPWYIEIYGQLKTVENHARTTLSTPLAHLFDTAPIRPKQEITTLTSQNTDIPADELNNDSASFSKNAATADGQINQKILLPKGESSTQITPTNPINIARHLKFVRHIFGQTKTLIKDIKNYLGK